MILFAVWMEIISIQSQTKICYCIFHTDGS